MARAGLTPERVVAAGADLADEVGLQQLTLASVAERFGVALPSLYKHVRGVEGLQRGIAVLATRELGDALGRAAMGRSGVDALTAVAEAHRRFAREHPGRYAATVRAPAPEHREHVEAAEHVLQVVLAVLAGYGLEGDAAVDAARAVRSALHGFADLEAAGGFGLPRDVDRSYEHLVAGLDAALRAWGPAAPSGSRPAPRSRPASRG